MSGIVSDNQGRSSGLVKSTTVAEYDDDKVQSNIALLGFKTAVNGSLAKYNLQDQIIDEYEDATGIDAGASTNERLTSGVYDGATSATITGGSTAVDGDYTVHTITADGNFVTNATITVDYLIVGGGGGGGQDRGVGGKGGGGGGGAGVLSAASQSFAAATYAAVIGAGGAQDVDGGDTTFNSLTAGGGGAGGAEVEDGNAGRATDGSGGGGGSHGSNSGGAGNGNGNAGGDGRTYPGDAGGGGGGRGGVGQNAPGHNEGGDGGAGLSNSITGSAVYYGAGGGGGTNINAECGVGGSSVGGDGAHGSQIGQDATGYGNGGGGSGLVPPGTAGAGSDGVVIVRRLTAAAIGGGDLTLQSTDTTASTANPDYADMVCLIEDAEGTATLNTDIKGYISEDSGVTFTEGTFVDEGSWGTNKKIIAFHDLDISAQSGSSMCYKITTHNQSAGSKETKIHATSIGWKA